MLKHIFNLPANPFHDDKEPVFLTVGDVCAAVIVTVAITGTAYCLVEYGDDVLNYIFETSNSEQVLEQGVAMSLAHTPKYL